MRQVQDVALAVALGLVFSVGLQAIVTVMPDGVPTLIVACCWAIVWAFAGPGIIIWRSRR